MDMVPAQTGTLFLWRAWRRCATLPASVASIRVMANPAPFPHAEALARLDAGDTTGLSADLVDTPQQREVLHTLLKTSEAVHRAAVGTTQVADALRRDQKFVRPGPPSAHLVRLRQQQAAARQAANQARQAFIVAADAFVRTFALVVPARTSLEVFAQDWIRRTFKPE
jgi:hypothetical protein